MTGWARAMRTAGLLVAVVAGVMPGGAAWAHGGGSTAHGSGSAYARQHPSANRVLPAPGATPTHQHTPAHELAPAYETVGAPGSYGRPAREHVRPSAPAASAEPSRAGSRAGVGRERPGRAEESATEQGADTDVAATDPEEAGGGDGGVAESADASVPSEEAVQVTPTPAQQPPGRSGTQAVAPAEPVLRVLPLGSGLVLIGLGLGLAFIGLRLRRS
ncbi:hypothetical protein [Streptomyces sp. NPDC006668]|uniref:hypothetical protein n=1 Tax=Streptomyces sp. NPDC006668 TaxID=3156903 RepID=UPI00340C5E45